MIGISTIKLRFSRILKNYKSGIYYAHYVETQMLNLEAPILNCDNLTTNKNNHHNKKLVVKLMCIVHITISKQ